MVHGKLARFGLRTASSSIEDEVVSTAKELKTNPYAPGPLDSYAYSKSAENKPVVYNPCSLSGLLLIRAKTDPYLTSPELSSAYERIGAVFPRKILMDAICRAKWPKLPPIEHPSRAQVRQAWFAETSLGAHVGARLTRRVAFRDTCIMVHTPSLQGPPARVPRAA